MLIQFSFENYLSFKADSVLDLRASKATELRYHVRPVCNEKLLPVAAVYGANASGKTNLVRAFAFMRRYVLDSFAYGGYLNDSLQHTPLRDPFLFDSGCNEKGTVFEVFFISPRESGSRTFNYGFALDDKGVKEEWLNIRSKTAREFRPVFYRNRNDLDLQGLPAESGKLIRLTLQDETLVASLGAKLKIEKIASVAAWFKKANILNFGNPEEAETLSRTLPPGFATDRSVQDNVVNFLASFDPSIRGFDIEETPDAIGNKRLSIRTIHKTTDGKTAMLPLDMESAGTLKMLSLYPVLVDTLSKGGLLVVDELNSRLHPLLQRLFILSFINPAINKNNAQLIFTTHDTWQLANDTLRRDEIWFTEKDENGISTLYSLQDFVDEEGEKIRKDSNFEKNYLLGKYGAIPRLKNIALFQENQNVEG